MDSWNYESILLSAFLVGFIDMGFEMLWFRLLGIFNKHTAYNFPSILFIFLIALALGGWFWGGKVDKVKDPVRLFWKLQIAVGIVSALSFLLMWMLINLPQLQPWLQENFNQFQPARLRRLFAWQMSLCFQNGYSYSGLLRVLPADIHHGFAAGC